MEMVKLFYVKSVDTKRSLAHGKKRKDAEGTKMSKKETQSIRANEEERS